MILVREPSSVQPTRSPAARPIGSTEIACRNAAAETEGLKLPTSTVVCRPPTALRFVSVRSRQAVPPGGAEAVQRGSIGISPPILSGANSSRKQPETAEHVESGRTMKFPDAKLSDTVESVESAANGTTR